MSGDPTAFEGEFRMPGPSQGLSGRGMKLKTPYSIEVKVE